MSTINHHRTEQEHHVFRNWAPGVRRRCQPLTIEIERDTLIGMIDSITSMHTTMQQAQLMQQVQTSVMARAIETAEMQGQAMVDLIAVSSLSGSSQVFTDPMLGQNVDTFA